MILGYWEIPGKCQPIRFLLEMVNEKYTDKRYTFKNSQEWFNQDKQTLGLDCPNLPYLIDGDFKLTESNAIINYILDKYKKPEWKGVNNDQYKVDELRFFLTDVQSLGFLSSKGDQSSFEKFQEKIQYLYQLMNKDKQFIFGYFTVADLFSWEAIHRLQVQWPELYQKYADKFDIQLQNIEKIPEIQQYIESGRCLKLQPLKK